MISTSRAVCVDSRPTSHPLQQLGLGLKLRQQVIREPLRLSARHKALSLFHLLLDFWKLSR